MGRDASRELEHLAHGLKYALDGVLRGDVVDAKALSALRDLSLRLRRFMTTELPANSIESYDARAQSEVPDQWITVATAAELVSAQYPTGSIYFDFANKRQVEGDRKARIPSNQLWQLLELGIRQGLVHLLDCYLVSPKWRLKREDFDPRRCFIVVISKLNKQIRPFGLKFLRDEAEENIWDLRGLESTQHTFNILKAQASLDGATKATEKQPPD